MPDPTRLTPRPTPMLAYNRTDGWHRKVHPFDLYPEVPLFELASSHDYRPLVATGDVAILARPTLAPVVVLLHLGPLGGGGCDFIAPTLEDALAGIASLRPLVELQLLGAQLGAYVLDPDHGGRRTALKVKVVEW